MDAPAELQRRCVDYLRAYWYALFAETWAELEPRLREEAESARLAIEAGRLFELLAPFRSELREDAEARVLERPSNHEHEVEVSAAARLQVRRLAAQQPRTTAELAPLVGLSVSGLSKHLRALTDAGLLTSRRDGWYVLYSVDRDRLAELSGELLGYLEE